MRRLYLLTLNSVRYMTRTYSFIYIITSSLYFVGMNTLAYMLHLSARIGAKLWRIIIGFWNILISMLPFLINFPLLTNSEIYYLDTSIIDIITPIIFTFFVTISSLNLLLSYVIFDREALVLYSVRLRR